MADPNGDSEMDMDMHETFGALGQQETKPRKAHHRRTNTWHAGDWMAEEQGNLGTESMMELLDDSLDDWIVPSHSTLGAPPPIEVDVDDTAPGFYHTNSGDSFGITCPPGPGIHHTDSGDSFGDRVAAMTSPPAGTGGVISPPGPGEASMFSSGHDTHSGSDWPDVFRASPDPPRGRMAQPLGGGGSGPAAGVGILGPGHPSALAVAAGGGGGAVTGKRSAKAAGAGRGAGRKPRTPGAAGRGSLGARSKSFPASAMAAAAGAAGAAGAGGVGGDGGTGAMPSPAAVPAAGAGVRASSGSPVAGGGAEAAPPGGRVSPVPAAAAAVATGAAAGAGRRQIPTPALPPRLPPPRLQVPVNTSLGGPIIPVSMPPAIKSGLSPGASPSHTPGHTPSMSPWPSPSHARRVVTPQASVLAAVAAIGQDAQAATPSPDGMGGAGGELVGPGRDPAAPYLAPAGPVGMGARSQSYPVLPSQHSLLSPGQGGGGGGGDGGPSPLASPLPSPLMAPRPWPGAGAVAVPAGPGAGGAVGVPAAPAPAGRETPVQVPSLLAPGSRGSGRGHRRSRSLDLQQLRSVMGTSGVPSLDVKEGGSPPPSPSSAAAKLLQTQNGRVRKHVVSALDQQTAKRVMANRQSAARSKQRQRDRLDELEKTFRTLQHQRAENHAERQQLNGSISALTAEQRSLEQQLAEEEGRGRAADEEMDRLLEELAVLRQGGGGGGAEAGEVEKEGLAEKERRRRCAAGGGAGRGFGEKLLPSVMAATAALATIRMDVDVGSKGFVPPPPLLANLKYEQAQVQQAGVQVQGAT